MKFNSRTLTSSLVDGALGIGGAVIGQEVGALLPASVDPMYADIGKVVIGCFAPAFIKGKAQSYAKSIGIGLAAQGGLNLVNTYLLNDAAPAATQRVAGYPINSNALGGYPINSNALGRRQRAVSGV
jgi:hypothetical protein